jgi:NADH-quinone oxidoreductase subunit L
VGGVVGGWLMYGHRKERDPLHAIGPMWNVLENRYYIDAFYMSAIVYPIRDTWSAAVNWFNQTILDGVVNGVAMGTRGLAQLVNLFDHDVIDGAVNGAAGTAGFSGGILKYIQSGSVQRYMAFLFVGVLVLAIVFTRVV